MRHSLVEPFSLGNGFGATPKTATGMGALPSNDPMSAGECKFRGKSSLLLSFLESVPDATVKTQGAKSLQMATPPFEDVVKSAQEAAVLVY